MLENKANLVGPDSQTLDQIKRAVFEALAAKHPEAGLIFDGKEESGAES